MPLVISEYMSELSVIFDSFFKVTQPFFVNINLLCIKCNIKFLKNEKISFGRDRSYPVDFGYILQ
jgi:hypothetical protein